MNDLRTLTAQPSRLTVDGQVYDLYPLTIEDFGRLQEWVDRQFPDPFDLVNKQIAAGRVVFDEDGNETREEYNMAQQQFLFRIALEKSGGPPHLLGKPEADVLLQTVEGVKQLLMISLRKGCPDFSDEQAEQLYRKLTIGDIARIYQATNLDMVMGGGDSPKAQKPSGAAKPNRRERRRKTGGTSSTKR